MGARADDIVAVDPAEEPARRRGRTIGLVAGVCAVLLAIAVTGNALRSHGGTDGRLTPAADYFTAPQIDALSTAPIGHQSGRPLHYLRLANDGSVGFGICAGEHQLLHFVVQGRSVERAKLTDEPCIGGFEVTDAVKSVIAQRAATAGAGRVEVTVDSHNRLSPLIEVTRASVTVAYGIDGVEVGPTRTDVTDPALRAAALQRILAVASLASVQSVCAWIDRGTMSVTGTGSGVASSGGQVWEYVGTPVLQATAGPIAGQLPAGERDLTPYLPPPPAAAAALGSAAVTGVCRSSARVGTAGAPQGPETAVTQPVVDYFTQPAAEPASPGDPRASYGTPAATISPDGTLLPRQ
ncbi:hypothetical protein [Cumulibacter manganitolerans]|uniref:hypothetical protein n=1 Tax=Cumulibacter manganitolerans TaxID=1884992 RepID=UPI001294BBE1|nr:hypothetical protein [Cumulibacter manganitolerans]